MKTTYILHGGESSRKTQNNEAFFRQILDCTNKELIKILCVYFARPEHRWQESFYEDRQSFEEQAHDKTLHIEMAERDEFEEQIKNADVIFINGGFKGFLKEALLSIKDLPAILQGKVIVGISAGANILAKYYYSQGAEDIREGIGLLPIKVFCHYSEELSKELGMLEIYKESLPIYKILEKTFVLVEI